LHPFITQQKFTGPFVPPMNLKPSFITKSPAPGIQQQQQAEAQSKQRSQAQQAAQMQAQNASALAAMQMGQYQQQPHVASPPMYNSMYPANQQGAPPPYPTQTVPYVQPIGMMHPPHPAMQLPHYNQQVNLHAQATTRATRQRASTLDQQQSGIPPALQRVVSHLDPNAPIRLQPSPAYFPPPADGVLDMTPASARRRTSRAGGSGHGRGNHDYIRTLEDRSIEEVYMMGTQPWH